MFWLEQVKANLTGVNLANVEPPENRPTTANGQSGDDESSEVFRGFRISLLKPQEPFSFPSLESPAPPPYKPLSPKTLEPPFRTLSVFYFCFFLFHCFLYSS
ncbi:hypothetical protein VNO77_02913 [Canavalia gladiata]|uniref:Uncharacterized protein n=1 Tax=Canavalia gladiata TaxID=3824 RepID=A0AAN9MVW3_CANGL